MAIGLNDTLLLQVKGQANTQTHIHTLHFRVNGAGDAPNALMDQYMSACAVAYRACFTTASTPIQMLRVDHVCGSVPLTAPVERNIVFASGQGSKVQTPQIVPAYMAAVVAEKSTLAGRRRQGRFFLGGLDVACLNGDNISTAYQGQIQAYCNALLAAFVTPPSPSLQLVVHSRYLARPHAAYVDGSGNTVPAYTPGNCQEISAPVAQLVVSGRATTMRSRKVGHGT